MAYIMGFIVSTYNTYSERPKLPYRPLIGETFEFSDDENNYTFFAE